MQFFKGHVSRLAVAALLAAPMGSLVPVAAYAQQIVVQGNSRVDAETIRSYFSGTDQARVNQSVRELYATGLFSNVSVNRAGGSLVVRVSENAVVNRVAFEGNSKLKSEQLAAEIQTKSRGAYSPNTVQADIERIRDLYKRGGRGDATVTARTVDLPNGRLDVVYTVNEGDKTGVRSINFVGNSAYSAYRLRNIMQTTEMNFLSFFKSTDVYDPERIAADQELIRRFYLKNGYADFRIVGADAVYDPASKGYVITVTVDEGQQYRVSSVNVDSRSTDVDVAALERQVRMKAGDIYNGDLVEKSVEGITREVARRGYAFSQARPRGDKNPADGTIALSFVVEEGPRVYIERVNVRGNTRTRDYVVRREFELGEGDAYNRVLVDRAEKRLNNLGYFKKVRITNEPGSTADRVVINVDVEDQSTGSFAVSGGYSTTDGFIGEVSVSESNFMGRGQYVRAAVSYGQYSRGFEFNFTEPFFLDRRLAAGFDIFHKQSDNTRYSLYQNWVTGGTIRFGLPITDEITFSPRYSIYQNQVKIPNTSSQPFNDCSIPLPGITPVVPTAVNNCLTNGEASLAVKEAQGTRLVSLVGYTLTYNTLDNNRNPQNGMYAELRQDFAGVGGDARFVRTTGDMRYYYPVYDDLTLIGRVQGGNIVGYGNSQLRITDHFNLGPGLVRGFAPGGIGPRDVSPGVVNASAGLGGTSYYGASVELQFPIFGLPKDLGLRGAVFADAGSLFNYAGKTNFAGAAPCAYYNNVGGPYVQSTCLNVYDARKIRSSVGASILWSSPLGPIRFDYAVALSKANSDVTQAFRFSGGTSF